MQSELEMKNILGFMKKKVTPFGTGAKVDCPKEYLGKTVYLVITEYVKGINRKQSILFPELVEDYVEDNNPVRFIDAFVANLNLKDLGFQHAELKETGRPPYDPVDLWKKNAKEMWS